MKVAPGFDKVGDGRLCPALGSEPASVQAFAFQRGEAPCARAAARATPERPPCPHPAGRRRLTCRKSVLPGIGPAPRPSPAAPFDKISRSTRRFLFTRRTSSNSQHILFISTAGADSTAVRRRGPGGQGRRVLPRWTLPSQAAIAYTKTGSAQAARTEHEG